MAFKLITLLAVAAVAVCSTSASSRIVGGVDASIDDYPAVVQVEFLTIFTWTQQCGGVVLNSVYILSAAHCFSGSLYSDRERRIRAGTANRDSGGVIVEISHAINHPNYDSNTLDADISVVRLESALPIGTTIQQATIISQGFEFPANIPVTYVGWGLTSPTDSTSHAEVLKEVEVQTVDSGVCAQRYQSLDSPRLVTDNMICAGVLGQGERDACRDDAGGPLLYQGTVIGVISWGQGCGLPTFPSVNTKVSAFTDWIVSSAV